MIRPLVDPVASFDHLLETDPYALDAGVKTQLLLTALQAGHDHHFGRCSAYRKYCERRGVREDGLFGSIAEIPWLPAQAFKEQADLLCSVPRADIRTTLRSSATSGVPSTVFIDKTTARRQVRALAAVTQVVLGSRRRPFLVLDADPRASGPGGIGARSAAVAGFLNLARDVQYFMRSTDAGLLEFDIERFASALGELPRDEPVCVFGFTYVLYVHALAPLLASGRRIPLPPGSKVVHIGGWKKLADREVSKARFNADVSAVFDIDDRDAIDFYGFTEQMGVTYPDSPAGDKVTPAFADVIVRHPGTLEPQPDGQEGLLEFVTPLPYSYPGIAVLTDDIGVVTGRGTGPDGWTGTRFRMLGRAKQAEVRGCGDIMGERLVQPTSGLRGPEASVSPEGARLLFDATGNHAPTRLEAAVEMVRLPRVADIDGLFESLREGRKLLDGYGIDDLIALIAAAAQRWASPQSPLAPLRHQGLLFLCQWCRPESLRAMADRALGGHRGFLDGFRPEDDTHRRLLSTTHRGVAVHWLSGNVPLLGMLTLVQSALARNANLLKAASTFAHVVPLLLDAFHGLTVKRPGGRELRGDDLLASIAVVYFPREDRATAERVSAGADLRLAWGGREAIESILALPRKYGCEDIIFGPKLSFMAIGRESLETPRQVARTARLAAIDASVFDQYACASPHTIFVERGAAAASPRDFAALLADHMARTAIRIPKAPVDAGTAAAIERTRLRYEFTAELWRSSGTEWTVLYDEAEGLATPCYSRVITVRAVDDVLSCARWAHPGIQTVGLSMSGARKMTFAREAGARGAERFPDLGRMTYFDSPWDGLFPLDRMVRWISIGGPL